MEIIGTGTLTKDPEQYETTSGKIICKMSIATNKPYTKDGERQTDFFTVITWNKQAENCLKYLKKGSKIAVSGDPQVRSYETNDGVKKYTFEIVARELEFLSPAKVTELKADESKPIPIDDDSMPF
jgi:single-strand DNA-binding protein